MKVEDETELSCLYGAKLKTDRKQHQVAQETENLIKAVEDSD